MEQKQMVDILRKIIRMSGPAYLEKGICFVNAFADLGGTEKDIQLLRYLVETDGHTALLNAGELPAAQQRLCYSHTVSRLCESRLISEELANDVCGSFWRAVYNTEPPVAYKKREEPASKPDEIYAQACECVRNGNTAEAIRLFRQAAELGHAEAQCRLGYRLMEGIGTAKDDAQAVDWFRKSAAQGYEDAKKRLPALEADFAAEWKRDLSQREPVPPIRPTPPDPSPKPTKREPNRSSSPPNRSTSERFLLTLGWACLISAAVYQIEWGGELYQDWQGWGVGTVWLVSFILIFVPIAYNQYRLWEQNPFLFPESDVLTHILALIQIVGTILATLCVGLGVLAELTEGRYAFGWIAIFPIYHVWWMIWAVKSAKRYI